jgi:hypothetical protein
MFIEWTTADAETAIDGAEETEEPDDLDVSEFLLKKLIIKKLLKSHYGYGGHYQYGGYGHYPRYQHHGYYGHGHGYYG